ncbi:hypothetical protein GCM10010254_23060 [Streptomyces chromofuscus]|nr:hypothetical protein GCM10010254_23060 [Streptomyces chromofuscus]
MSEIGAQAAYAVLRGRVAWFGPTLFTKAFSSVGKKAAPTSSRDRAFSTVSRPGVCGSWPGNVGRETGHAPDGSVADWGWRKTDWSPHQYGVRLSALHAAGRQAAATDG